MSKLKIEISSVPDRENLVAEIWHNEILVAEINQETKNLDNYENINCNNNRYRSKQKK
mgnify:CR=1 FL=1